jgi:hypothetical protein
MVLLAHLNRIQFLTRAAAKDGALICPTGVDKVELSLVPYIRDYNLIRLSFSGS